MSSHEEAPLTLKQKREIDSTLKKQNFEEMQDLLQRVSVKASTNMEYFNMAKDYLRDNLKATKEQRQEAFNFVIKNLPPEAKRELVAELKGEKKSITKIEEPVQQEQRGINQHIMDKLGRDETLSKLEINLLEKNLEEKGKKTGEKLNEVVSRYEKVRDELLVKVDDLLEKYENKTATQEDKKNLVTSVALLQEVHTILNTLDLQKAGEITSSPSTKSISGLKFSVIGSQFENAVYRTFIDAQKSLDDTVKSLENICTDMEKITKVLNSNKDVSTFLSSYEKHHIDLDRNANSLMSSIDNLKYQEGVADGAYGQVRNFAVQSVGTVASLGVSTIFSTGTLSSMLFAKGLVKGAELGADYTIGAASTYYGTGSFTEIDAAKQTAATVSNLLGIKGIKGTQIKTIVSNGSKIITRVYSNVVASTNDTTEIKINNPVRIMEGD